MTTVHVVYTDIGVFLETLGFILYNNTFVVNSLLSDVYLIEVQYNAMWYVCYLETECSYLHVETEEERNFIQPLNS